MSNYVWVITKDFYFKDNYTGDSNLDEAGVSGPTDLGLPAKLDRVKTKIFRMYSLDGVPVVEGIICGSDFTGEEPLEEYGKPLADCTSIEYYSIQTNTWEPL